MRRSFSWLLIGIAAAVLASSAWAQEQCAPPRMMVQLMTPAAGYLPPGSGLVVGLFAGSGDGNLPVALSLTRGRRSIALARQSIGPGLYRFVAQGQRLTGRYRVDGIAGSPEIYFRRGTVPATPTAPAVDRVERYLVASGDGRRLEVRAYFAFPMPEGVVAVLSYWGDDDTADAFVRGEPTARQIVLYTAGGDCPSLPEGTTPPPENARVRVAYVDQHGQVSRPSEPRLIE